MESDQEYSLEDEESAELATEAPINDQMRQVAGSSEESHWSESSSFASTEESDNEAGSDLQPSAIIENHASAKRLASSELEYRPFKRHKSTVNAEYLQLLNKDIDDAAAAVISDDQVELSMTQVGLTFWSPWEKQEFFEALGRQGKSNLSGIASRIGSKSVLEVSQYIHLLEEARALRQKHDDHAVLVLSEHPPAVELSQHCCHAQDEAADAISLTQERREQQRERVRWGEYWEITPKAAREIEKDPDSVDDLQLAFGRFFYLTRWLQLSQRIFMNSSVPGDNWHFIDDTPPSVWATAFEDFYSITGSVTRRLVQATLFISMSRIRAKRELHPKTKSVVRKKDVEAAIASLGLPQRATKFWAKSARRLRLDVYLEPLDRDQENDEDPLTYSEVESALEEEGDSDVTSEMPDVLPTDESLSDNLSDGSEVSENERTDSSLGEEHRRVEEEMRDVLRYSAMDFPETSKTRQALQTRIEVERRQEQDAERCDDYKSWQAESEMWNVLQRRPPVEKPKPQEQPPPTRSNMKLDNLVSFGLGWEEQTRYFSEWETGQSADNQGQ